MAEKAERMWSEAVSLGMLVNPRGEEVHSSLLAHYDGVGIFVQNTVASLAGTGAVNWSFRIRQQSIPALIELLEEALMADVALASMPDDEEAEANS